VNSAHLTSDVLFINGLSLNILSSADAGPTRETEMVQGASGY